MVRSIPWAFVHIVTWSQLNSTSLCRNNYSPAIACYWALGDTEYMSCGPDITLRPEILTKGY